MYIVTYFKDGKIKNELAEEKELNYWFKYGYLKLTEILSWR